MKKLKDEKKLELGFLCLFAVLYVIITIFHEPWFDEAQAWQIAKCASIKEILFDIPHYEGHPPLWHLILAVPAKLGIPFELGLKSVGFIISISSVIVLLFKSQMPRIARLLLPFSYFFFYQYGIIVRPYCLMLLLMLLLGIEFNSRADHPWRITGLLALICLTSAYGIVIAGGIAIGMVLEICKENGIVATFKDLFYNSRTQSLIFLLAIALIIIAEIFPRSDTYIPTSLGTNTFILCLLCALFTFPGECFLTTGSWFSLDRALLQFVDIPISEFISFFVIGAIIWFFLICFSSKKDLKYLLIPYTLFSVFAAKIYFIGHHLGIVFILFLFWFEIQFHNSNHFEIGFTILSHIESDRENPKHFRYPYIVIGLASLLMPMYWTTSASLHEINLNYSFGRNISSFLSENSMDTCLIFTDYNVYGSLFPQAEKHKNYINPYMSGVGTELSAYFHHNISMNLNDGDNHRAFTYHKLASYHESQNALMRLREKGSPEIIIGHPPLELIYPNKLDYSDFSPVEIVNSNFIWKSGYRNSIMPIFVRNDLLDTYCLEPLNKLEQLSVKDFQVTEEMREQYENGVPVEDIIKPYMDILFGEEEKK